MALASLGDDRGASRQRASPGEGGLSTEGVPVIAILWGQQDVLFPAPANGTDIATLRCSGTGQLASVSAQAVQTMISWPGADATTESTAAWEMTRSMSGGAGSDTFVFNEFLGGEVDLILGFEAGVDSFRMTGVENEPGSGLQGRVDALDITDAVIDGAIGVTLTYLGHTIQVTGISAADLGVTDFEFL